MIIHLSEITYFHVKDIYAYVKREFDKKYTVSRMTKWLHANEFVYKKSHAVPGKADSEQQKKFLRYYVELEKKAGEKEPNYFSDSVHPQHQTRLVHGWILKGERMEIATTGKQYRLNFIGGICLKGHRFIYKPVDKVNGESIALFLSELRKRHPDRHKIHLIWDQASYHRDKEVLAFAKGFGIQIHYLPLYSPDLNPIEERIWKLMHEQVTYNQYYETFSDFTEATLHFFRDIGKNKSILRSRITNNFQLLGAPSSHLEVKRV